MKDLTLPTLLPCPFCGAGETQMRENGRVWGGKGYGEPSSVSVVHWCVKVDGQPSRVLERVGRDKHSAIEAWNTRAALSSHHEDGGRAESRGVVVPMEANEAMLAAVRKRPHPTRPDGWDTHHAALWRAMVAAHQATGGAP